MNLWARKSFLSTKLGRLKDAESRLLDLSRRFAQREPLSTSRIVSFDTKIPRSIVPVRQQDGRGDRDEAYQIHGVHIFNEDARSDAWMNREDPPLVMLHGYMAGAAYFYRNFAGLSDYFRNIYSLDLLGWGLSSRPAFRLIGDSSLETSEDFFVQSLEHWRRTNGVERMVLAGHSMGGYVGVAYCGKITVELPLWKKM